jgi:predicted RND superfamily exporter protein
MKDRAEGPLPSSDRAVSQYLFLYENSGNPQDLFRLVTASGDAVNVWFNMKSGDNRNMAKVKQKTEQLLDQSDLTFSSSPEWAGITYVNLVWQNVMVRGMAWALAGGYVVVFFMMLFLFRSLRWALLSLIPLTVTLVFIYGLVGLVGKDYDMPVAVLSSLSIGIAIDFAIHFIQRSRQLIDEHGSWPEARRHVAGEPSRAIARNAIVIAVGFTPLFFAPLRPYFTVGTFMVLIMSFSGLATLIGLNAVVESIHEYLPGQKE